MKIAATDPAYGAEAAGSTGSIGGGEAADAIADHEDDPEGAHVASGISITDGTLRYWPMLGLSSFVDAGNFTATNVEDALAELAARIAALLGTSTSVRHWPMLALSTGIPGSGSSLGSVFLTKSGGGGGDVFAHGSLGATETIDLANGNYHWGTLNANCTFTFTVTAGIAERWLTLELIEDGTGGWTPTWPGSVVWVDGTVPTHTTTASTTTIYAFFTRDAGATWFGGKLGAGVSGGTPALTFSTTNATGSASTAILSDATIALFDTTVPANIPAPGVASSTGSVGKAARRDHGHALTYHDEPLTDGASNFIFAGGDIVVVIGVANP